MIYLRGNTTDLRAGSWEQSTTSKSHPSPFDKLCQRTSISTISKEHFRLGKSTCKSLYNRYCAFRIMDICWMNHRCHRKSKRISTTICFFLSLIFLPPSIPHSLPFWWEVRTLLWVYDTKTRRFSANRIFEPNLLANTSALQRLLLISNFENKSRLFATEWNLWGAFAIGTPFLLCTVGYTKFLGEDFFRCLSRGSNRFFILFHCLSVRLVGYSLITLILPTIELERIFLSADRYRFDSFPTPFSLLVREFLRAPSNKFKTSSKA